MPTQLKKLSDPFDAIVNAISAGEVTCNHLAERAGVACSTVTRRLNGQSSWMKPETLDLLLVALEQIRESRKKSAKGK